MAAIVSKIKRFISPGDARTRMMNLNVLVSFLLKGGSILISLVLVPMTLNCLTTFEYGVWLTLSSVLHWIDYFDIGLGNGLRNKLTEAIAERNFEKGRIYTSTTFFLLSLIVSAFFVIYFIVSPFLNWNSILNTGNLPIERLNFIVMIVFGICCVNFVVKIVGIIHVAYQRPMINNLMAFLGNLFSLITIYILTLTAKGNLGNVAVCFTLAPIIVYVLAFPYTFWYKYKSIRPSLKCIDLKYSKDLVGLGIRFFILQIVCLILFSTSNILIAKLFSPEAVTPYNIGYRYVNIVMMVFTIILAPLWTAITDASARKEYNWIVGAMRRMSRILLACLGAIVVLIVISKPAIAFWTGGKVEVSYGLLISLGVYIGSLMFSNVYASYANGVGKLKIQMIAAIIQGVVYIPLAILMSKFLGSTGIAVALAIVSLIPSIMLFESYKRSIYQYIQN